jgi:hypothetical protein
MDLEKLKISGWTFVEGITSNSDMLELGKSLGTPVLSPNGELVKEIRRIPQEEAFPGSQSAIYGAGSFPLHTDTVFWPLPVRYVILRARGDLRRPTTVRSFSDLFNECDSEVPKLVAKSVWLVKVNTKHFYCSMKYHLGDSVGWRYDFDLMTPVNDAAKKVNSILHPLVCSRNVTNVVWLKDVAVIFSNWNVLHGRGPQPDNEGVRILERLYVR